MPENIRGNLIYELICGIGAGTVLVNRVPVHGGGAAVVSRVLSLGTTLRLV